MRPSSFFAPAVQLVCSSLLFMAVLALVLAWMPSPARAQTDTEIRPVDFMVSGQVTELGGAALERSWVRIVRLDTEEVVVDRAFSGPDGSLVTAFTVPLEVTVGLPEEPPAPELPGVTVSSFQMGRIGPNPYPKTQRGNTLLAYLSPPGSPVPELELFDVRGRRQKPGQSAPSGVYFYRLRFGERLTNARKLLLLSDRLPQVKLVQASSEAELRGELPAAALAARKAPEGVLSVRVEIRKAGYTGQELSLELDSTSANPIQVELAPEATPSASFTKLDGLAAGEAVAFDASASLSPDGQALHYSWEFGDGSRADGETVAHVYRSAGSYDVSLTVRSTWGSVDTAVSTVSVLSGPPPAATDAEMVVLVADALGNLLPGVEVDLVDGSSTATTDASGAATLGSLPTELPFSLRLRKDGYATQIFPTELPAGTQFSSVELTMRQRRTPAVLARIEDGGAEFGEDGVFVDLPPDALVHSDGSPASGEATLSLTPVDVTDDLAAKAFPGGYQGVQPDGNRGLILSYGVSEFAIEQGNEALQLAPGALATIEIPIYTGGVNAGDFIALWSVDESSGLWTEEGVGEVVTSSASPSGFSLRASVGHFSWWNADRFEDDPYRPIPRCKIKDSEGLPTLDIPAGGACFIEGRVSGPNAPVGRPTAPVPPSGGRPLPMPSGRSCSFSASAEGGSLRGTIDFVGQANVEEELIIVLETLDPPSGLIQLPVDQEVSMTTDGEVDRWSLQILEGQTISLTIRTAVGSTLQGDARLRDPQGQLMESSSFSSASPAVLFAEEAAAGIWTVEVESSANAPGAYRLRGRLVESISLAADTAVEVDLVSGLYQPFTFELSAGTWYSLDYLRVAGSGSRTNWDLRAPDGSSLGSAFSTRIDTNAGLFLASQDGVHRLDLLSENLEGRVRVTLRSAPELIAGGGHDLQADYKAYQYYRITGVAGRMMRAAADESGGFRGNYTWVDGTGAGLPTVWNYQFGSSNGSVAVVVPEVEIFLLVNSSYSAPSVGKLSYRLGLPYIGESVPLTSDAQGRSELSSTLDTTGQAKLHLFTAGAGDALELLVQPGVSSPLGQSASISVHLLNGGDILSPEFAVQARASGGSITAGLPPELLEVRSYLLPSAGTYAILVYDNEDGTGSYRLRVDQVSSSSSIVVDEDLVERPDATTRSVTAAFLAIQDGGSLEIAPGEYVFYDYLEMEATGAAIAGAGRDLTTLRRTTGGFILYAGSSIGSLRDLTLEGIRRSFDQSVSLQRPDGTVLEDLRIHPVAGSSSLAEAIEVNAGDGLVIRRVEVLDALMAVNMRNTNNVLIEDCLFSGDAQRVYNTGGHENTVQRNTWNSTAIGTAIQLDSGAGHQVRENAITISTSDFGAAANDEAIVVEDQDSDGSHPIGLVQDNRIVTNEAGLYLRAGYSGSKLVCERNRVEMLDSFGDRALHILPVRSDGTGTIIARNNVFLGVSAYRGVYCQQAEFLEEVWVANNTIQLAPASNTQAAYATIEIARANSGFSGALPVTVVNNVFSGIGPTTAVKISVDCTADSDFNLFHQYATIYADGTSTTGTNDLSGQDPLLMGDDLTLDDASPAIDSGAGVAQYPEVPTDDFSNAVRPQGTGVDRGAHER